MFVIDLSQSRYYEDEVHAKSATKISLKSWKREFVKDRPMQENGLVF
jgi:hypothetical protein